MLSPNTLIMSPILQPTKSMHLRNLMGITSIKSFFYYTVNNSSKNLYSYLLISVNTY
ncbi:hypothetical protein WKT22_02683 [Candidatus Lokiarchaeum ossiferum]